MMATGAFAYGPDRADSARTDAAMRLPHESLHDTDRDLITHTGGPVLRDQRRDGSTHPQGGTNA